MTKRELVKWLEKRKAEALETARLTKRKMIEEAKNRVFEEIDVQRFDRELESAFQSMLDAFDSLTERCKDKDITVHKYDWEISYTKFATFLASPTKLKDKMNDLISIGTPEYNETKRAAVKYFNDVELTYDQVIQTVKNLPTAKDGMEYLNKLGFDTLQICPPQKKQLPATIKINVDKKFLLLDDK